MLFKACLGIRVEIEEHQQWRPGQSPQDMKPKHPVFKTIESESATGDWAVIVAETWLAFSRGGLVLSYCFLVLLEEQVSECSSRPVPSSQGCSIRSVCRGVGGGGGRRAAAASSPKRCPWELAYHGRCAQAWLCFFLRGKGNLKWVFLGKQISQEVTPHFFRKCKIFFLKETLKGDDLIRIIGGHHLDSRTPAPANLCAPEGNLSCVLPSAGRGKAEGSTCPAREWNHLRFNPTKST